MHYSQPHHIELDAHSQQLLASLTERSGWPPEKTLRKALESFELSAFVTMPTQEPTQENALDMLKRKNLVGCLDEMPSDLSTNPAHMEGFGEHDNSHPH